MIKIDDWVIEKGEKAQGKIKITGYGIAMPATVICGVKDGPTILITAGIHSAEYVGIQAAMELAKEFQPEELKGNVIIVPLVNVSGFEHRTMSLVYEDGKNLNRVFPGDPEGTAADRIAYTIVTKLFSIADYYIDLHSGDGFEQLHPYVYYVGVVDEKNSREVITYGTAYRRKICGPFHNCHRWRLQLCFFSWNSKYSYRKRRTQLLDLGGSRTG